MTEVFDFIKWCFSTPMSGLVTIIILSGFANTVIELAKVLKGVRRCGDCTCEDD